MKFLLILFATALSALQAVAAEKGALLFSDEFSRPELGDRWRVQCPEFTVADGVLQAAQVQAHSAVGMVKVGCKDVIIEFKFQLGGATGINAVLNDRDFKEGHGGHICRVSLSPRKIFLADDKERLRHDIETMRKDPARKAEADKLVAGRSAGFPCELDPHRWYQMVITLLGDEMRVSLDGREVGSLKSSGLAHPMKSDFYFAVSGRDARFDDVRIWETAGAR